MKKGVCCKWTYIILSVFVFMLGFLAFAPMYSTGPPGECVDNDTTDVCQCQPWDEECEEPEDPCVSFQCLNTKTCCEGDGGTWETAAEESYNGYIMNIHGEAATCHKGDDWDEDSDSTNSYNVACALAGPDKTTPGMTTWLAQWNGVRVCGMRQADDCDWEAVNDTCECSYWASMRGWKDIDCLYGSCDEDRYACTCDGEDCENAEGDGPNDCDCDFEDGTEVLECHIDLQADGGCTDWGDEQDASGECADEMDPDYCPGTAQDFCEAEKSVSQGFFQAFVLFILAQVVLALAAALSVLSICTSKINCLKGCFTKFARLIIGFALLGGSVFASAAFALFDLKGVQNRATLINQEGMFETSHTLCSGQPGVLVENTTMDGVQNKSCLSRTPAFYLYVLLVVCLSWTACLAAFSTICCCNPEKAADAEGANEVGYQE